MEYVFYGGNSTKELHKNAPDSKTQALLSATPKYQFLDDYCLRFSKLGFLKSVGVF